MDRVSIGVKLAESAAAQPAQSAIAGILLQVVAVLQSAQTVASTITALLTSIGGLVIAYFGVRKAWRNRNKD